MSDEEAKPPPTFAAPPPAVIATEGATFAAPPASVEGAAPSQPGIPPLFLGCLLLVAFGVLFVIAQPGGLCPGLVEAAFLAALASGTGWARKLAMFNAVLSVLAIVLLLIFGGSRMGPGAWWFFAALALVQAFWFYVLQKDETVAYFSKPR